MDKFLEAVTANHTHAYFISPHVDDAILSAGETIVSLSKMINVTIVNIFNQGGIPPYSLSAKKFLKDAGYTNAEDLFNQRVKEEAELMNSVNLKIINLNYQDALFRTKESLSKIEQYIGRFVPELLLLYPVYRLNIISGKISSGDQCLMHNLKFQLEEIIGDNKAVVFCPMGVGKHVDHLITRQVCAQLPVNPIYWSDFPYNTQKPLPHVFINNPLMKVYEYSSDWEKKKELLRIYKSQINAVFPGGDIKFKKELFMQAKYE